jgi:hypothetical protein
MQRLEVSCAVRDIYDVSRLRVKILHNRAKYLEFLLFCLALTSTFWKVEFIMIYLKLNNNKYMQITFLDLARTTCPFV